VLYGDRWAQIGNFMVESSMYLGAKYWLVPLGEKGFSLGGGSGCWAKV